MDAAGWFMLGAPWDCSGSARGEQAAPHAFREAGLSAMVGRDVGDAATVIDRTDRDERTGVIALSETVRAAHALADDLAVAMTDLPGRRPLVVCGGACGAHRLPSDLRRIDAPAVVRDPVAAGRQAAAELAGTGNGVVVAPRPGCAGSRVARCGDVPPAGRPRLGSTRRRGRATGAVASTRGVSVADFRPDLDPTGDQATRVLDFLGRTLP
ncbi:hypothetical protein MPY17_06265 [Rhodococcus opacus]|uniref:hypothetical protein n=1 Tax=Rhodococcus opacus TaxID=37919 RepID=UPI001FF24067|nr:hypothetical protein [Rhodococcus opacus]UOT05351.1 hypothetical protein MPY17_06265 [Rhodococcus opacus]